MEEKATIILRSNHIFTAIDDEPVSGAVVIGGDRILAVTGDDEGAAYAGDETQIIDLGDQLVCPGFVDNHVFFTGHVWSHIGADLSAAATKAEAVDLLKAYSETIPADRTVLGHGLSADVLEEEADTDALMAVFGARPVIGFTEDRGGCIMNQAARDKFGFTEEEVYAEVCYKVFDEYLRDIPFIKEEYRKFSELLASRGVTAIKEIGFDRYSGFTSVLKELDDNKELMHRVYLVSQPVGFPMDYEYGETCRETLTSDFISWMGFNVMVDGEIDAHNADLIDEYKDLPGSHGEQPVDYEQIEKDVLEADRRGMRVALHAEGDAAVRRSVDIFETCRKVNGPRDARHAVTDLELCRPEELDRMASLGISTFNYVQIIDALGDSADFYGYDRVGEEGVKNYWCYARQFEKGVNMCCGTDMPLGTPDIPLSAYYAVNRTYRDGKPEGGINKECALTVAQILKAWSKNGQYANFREADLGTLEAGKKADIAVFDQNLFEMDPKDLSDAKVALTLCGGRIVYKAKKVAAIGDNCIDMYENLNRWYATGNAVDFAVNMKKLGIDTAVISTTGSDEFGENMVAELTKQGIDLSRFKVVEGQTAVSYMDLIGLDRTYLDYVEGVMADVQFTPEDIAFAASCDLVHSALWGNAHRYIKEIHENGARVCFDYATGYDPDDEDEELAKEVIAATEGYVDYPFISFDKRTEETDALLKHWVDDCGALIAVGTFGEDGSVAYDGERFYEYGIEKAELVNTIGAGDSYMAGFMNGVLNGLTIPECQALGAHVAAEVVSVFGPWVD